ncbi:MAG: VIT domain-containing protein [Myxococcota bacterium]
MLAVLAPAVAVAAVLVAAPWKAQPAPSATVLTMKTPPVASPRQGREAVELRPQDVPSRLRTVSLRGQAVELGQGTLEAAGESGPARPFVLERTKVEADVTGFVSAVTVTQEFKNPFSTPVEAVYVFPLPDDAAVDEMTLTAGARVIKASIQKREVARRMYEEAKSQGRRAALLDQERPNIFTQSVANLLPGEKVKVTLRYVAPLEYDDGAYTFNFPMVVGPRYVPGDALPGESQGTGTSPDTTRVLDASRITPPAVRSGRDISVEVRLETGAVVEELWSVSHRLWAERPSSSRAVVTLDPADRVPNKDLILRWRVSGTDKRAALLASGGKGGAFALMVHPEVKPTEAAVTPKEMVFVIDTSCSMSGAPLDAAKRAMASAMKQMNRDDTFLLIDFADRASSFHDEPLPNTAANVQRALSYLNALPSSGGTNQLEGLRRALARPEDPRRLRVVLLMTDGFIGNEREIFAEAQRLKGRARIFGFGIGSSVNHYLLSRLSEVGRGFYQYVRTDEDSGPAVERFVRRISRPLLTDVEIDWGGLEVFDVLPRQAPDLFDGQPLVLLGRVRQPGTGMVTVKGYAGGQQVALRTLVSFPAEALGGDGLKTMWARARIEEVDRQQHWGETTDAVREVTMLGLEYHLVTAYTSLVAVDTTPVTSRPAQTVAVPTEVPDKTAPASGKVPPGGHRITLQQPALRAGEDVDADLVLDGDDGVQGGVVGGVVGGVLYGRVGGAPETTTPAVPGGQVTQPVVATGEADGRDAHGEGDEEEYAEDFGTERARKRGGADVFTGAPRPGKGDGKAPPKEVYIPPAPGSSSVTDSLGQSDIMEAVLSHKAQLRACVDQHLLKFPGATGKLVVRWTIRANGTVTSVVVTSEELRGTPIATCVVQAIKGWKFPAGKQEATVSFPFKF